MVERITEGQAPESGEFLFPEEAYQQIALWLGTTVAEVEKKFDIHNLPPKPGLKPGLKPKCVIMDGRIDRSDMGIALYCSIIAESGIQIGAKLVCYLYDPGEVIIVDTGIRL
jgi:hypothetical protein